MDCEIKFRDLPFVPVEGQVIYYEEKRDSKANKFIRNNYDWLVTLFAKHGLEFCYMPKRAIDVIMYNAPYASAQSVDAMSSLSAYAVDHSVKYPLLLFALDIPVKDEDGNIVLQCAPIVTNWFKSTKNTFRELVADIKTIASQQSQHYHSLEQEKQAAARADIKFAQVKRGEKIENSGTRFSFSIDNEEQPSEESSCETNVRFSKRRETDWESLGNNRLGTTPNEMQFNLVSNYADEFFPVEAMKIVDEIKTRIDMLRDCGINTMFLHQLIDKEEKLSRLLITADYRVVLVDYGNREIKMSTLVKAVFLLFLKHPEGIRFKELPDYYSELLIIYQGLNPNGTIEKQRNSVREVTNPCGNSINEKCARIREAFISSFDERLAKNYFVTGKRGEPKRITLNRNLVTWEEK